MGGSCPSLEKYNLTNCSGIPGWVRRFPQAAPTEVPSPPRQPWPSPEIWDEHERGGATPGPLHRDINSQELQSQPGGDSASCPQPCRGSDNQQQMAQTRGARRGGDRDAGGFREGRPQPGRFPSRTTACIWLNNEIITTFARRGEARGTESSCCHSSSSPPCPHAQHSP